jgi:hypothetical protein
MSSSSNVAIEDSLFAADCLFEEFVWGAYLAAAFFVESDC